METEMPAYWPPWRHKFHPNACMLGVEWEKDVDEPYRDFIEHEWRRAIFDEQCAETHDISKRDRPPFLVVPVYFWPGDTVVLECRMCRPAYVYNGQIKKWRVWQHQHALSRFAFTHHQQPTGSKKWKEFEAMERNLAEVLGNGSLADDWLPMDSVSERAIRAEPRFFQREHRLFIHQASAGIQGLYNCYDDQSYSDRKLFYLLMAMLPFTDIKPQLDNRESSCDNYDITELPDPNWRWRFMPTFFDTGTSSDTLRKSRPNASDQHMGNRTVAVGLTEGAIFARNLNLEIVVIWTSWSPCTACTPFNGTRTREGHCVLRKIRKNKAIASTFKDWVSIRQFSWLSHFDKILDTNPFSEEGIRLSSSLLVTMANKQQDAFRTCFQERSHDDFRNGYFDGLLKALTLINEQSPAVADQFCLSYSRQSDNRFSYVITHFYQLQHCSSLTCAQ